MHTKIQNDIIIHIQFLSKMKIFVQVLLLLFSLCFIFCVQLLFFRMIQTLEGENGQVKRNCENSHNTYSCVYVQSIINLHALTSTTLSTLYWRAQIVAFYKASCSIYIYTFSKQLINLRQRQKIIIFHKKKLE